MSPANASWLPALAAARSSCSRTASRLGAVVSGSVISFRPSVFLLGNALRRGGPEVLEHLRVAGVAEADGDELETVRARLERARDDGRQPDRVPPAHVAYLVFDLHAAAAGERDVDLFVRAMAVRGRRAGVRRELLVAEAAARDGQRLPSVAGFQARSEPESLGDVLDVVLQVELRVLGHQAFP